MSLGRKVSGLCAETVDTPIFKQVEELEYEARK